MRNRCAEAALSYTPLRVVLVFAAALVWPPHAAADLTAVVNAVREYGCGGGTGGHASVQTEPALDEVARRLADGQRLTTALERAAYRSASSKAIEISHAGDDAALRRFLETEYCDTVTAPRFTAIGTHRQAPRTWIVLAEPFATEALDDPEAVHRRVLDLVNAARAEARRCGRQRFGPAAPLRWSAPLTRAAAAHAQDMASRDRLEHRGAEGSEPAERVERTGYAWQTVAENIAAGQRTAAAVVADWLSSPGHCANVMDPAVTEMGVAFAVDIESRGGVYWAQVFAAPR